MNFLDVQTNLKQKLSPVYILKGDSFFAKKTITQILEMFNVNSLSVDVFNDENFDAEMVVCSLQQFSFFDEKRVVIVENIYKDLNSKSKESISRYLKNPNPNAIFLINDSAGYNKFDFIKDAEIIDCGAKEGFGLEYISNYFKKFGIQISSQSVKKIYSYSLGDFSTIMQELKKLSDYAYFSKQLSDQDVEKLVTKNTELKVFDLTTALSFKNIKKAQLVLSQMLKEEEPPIKILGLISTHFKRMFFVKINKEKSNQQMANLLGVKEYAVTKAKEQAINFSATALKRIMEACTQVDYFIKSGEMSQQNALYYLIYQINVLAK